MKFFCLPNLRSQDVAHDDPSRYSDVKRPEGKKEFRDWSLDENLRHCFFILTEALVPGNRVTGWNGANPPFKLYGFIADYDTYDTIDWPNVDKALAAAPHASSHVTQTNSGGARLIWEFEEAQLIDNQTLTELFMKRLAKELKVRDIFPSFDEGSLEPTRYFEAGRQWRTLTGRPIPKSTLATLFLEAVKQGANKIKTDVEIPLEAVVEEIEKRWPKRIGSLIEGARVPLFWIDPYEPREGAVVFKNGIYAHSTRAGKSWNTWQDILGSAFVREYQTKRIGEAAEGIYFDRRHYWRK